MAARVNKRWRERAKPTGQIVGLAMRLRYRPNEIGPTGRRGVGKWSLMKNGEEKLSHFTPHRQSNTPTVVGILLHSASAASRRASICSADRGTRSAYGLSVGRPALSR
jgi:hypothetical protein